MKAAVAESSAFVTAFRGLFYGIRAWEHLDTLWERLRADAAGEWYIYAVGEIPPEAPASAEQVMNFISEVDRLLREEHDEEYCGIVYADDPQAPSFVKIFDPNNLGSSCGSSAFPPLPGWTMSKLRPEDLPAAFPQPGNRRRWWKRLFGG